MQRAKRLLLVVIFLAFFTLPVNAMAGQSLWDGITPTGTGYVFETIYNWGVAFSSSETGNITAIKYYRDDANWGVIVGRVWSESGTLLAEETFTDSYTAGWQEVSLPSPVSINANTLYYITYSSSVGRVVSQVNYFSGPINSGIFTIYGGYWIDSAGFPTNSSLSNYWVDMVFETTSAPTNTPTITLTSVPGVTETITPTTQPTSTSTPATIQDVTLTSGHIFHVERSITFGEAAIVMGLSVNLIANILIGAVLISKGFVK
jgi:hypothetical protein